MKFKCVIFDLDGTLVNTLGDIAANMNRALEEQGFSPFPEERYMDFVGNGIKKLAYHVLPGDKRDEETIEKTAALALGFYAEKPVVYSKPYPGIPELVAALQAMNVRTGVLTNKPDIIARRVVEGIFPAGSFDEVQGEIKGAPRKPDPSTAWDMMIRLGVTPRETIFAGDSEVDIETARAADCSVLAVSWGFRSREILEKAGAGRIIDTPEELLTLIRETRY